jgi:zona occludens toxin
MITFITGVPGSGKSYKALLTIYNNFSNSKNAKRDIKKEYHYCYTNINEVKFDKLKNVFPLDMDDLKSKLTILHGLYKEKNTDEVLIEKCKEFELDRVLFVIDECHNIFDTNDKILIWWLSYHRHLYHDIFLITQNLSLVFTKYKSFSEYFYRAKSSTLSLNKKFFYYEVFLKSNLANNAKSHTEKISKNQEVFELYHSGDSVESKNVILRLIFIALGTVALLSIFIYFYLGSYKKDDIHQDKKEQQVHQDKKEQQVHQDKKEQQYNNDTIDIENSIYISLNCSFDVCLYKSKLIPMAVINRFKDSFYFEVVTSHVHGDTMILYVFTDKKFNLFLGVEDDIDKISDSVVPDSLL